MKLTSLLFAAAVALPLIACDQPADDKPKAVVTSATTKSSAAPVASTTTTATASAAATPAAPVVLTPPAAPDGALTIDASGSSVGFVGAKLVGSHTGAFTKFAGWIALDKDKAEGGKAAIVIDLSSAKTDDPKLDQHLMSKDFFEVAKYPVSTFTLTEIKPSTDKGATHTLAGELDLHGQKKSIRFPAKITVDKDAVTATAEFSINRKDFGIVYAGMADNAIKDDVLIKLSIKAPRAKK
jgi:polyisoprenoid-binding protein YceI